MADRIVPLIMCGGAGTRLWPLSREDRPKQFINLFGPRSTFQETVLRVSDPQRFDRPIVVTGAAYRALVRSQLEEIRCQADILLESARRDSGPAILAGTLFAARRGPDSVVLALAADHIVQDTTAFVAACATSLNASRAGHIVTFGVKPDRPATEYGYIAPGAVIDGPVRIVTSFVEKPDLATATQYMENGYLWNSGNFMFRAETMFDEYRTLDAGSVKAVTRAVDEAERDQAFVNLKKQPFESAKPISIDYAVMERTTRAAVIPVAVGWSDVGSWQTVWELSDKDSQGNARNGVAVFENARNCYVSSDKAIVALEGVDDLVVVATQDAVLVSRRAGSGALKTLVAKLKDAGPHLTGGDAVEAPRLIEANDQYRVQRIVVKVGGRTSLYQDRYRSAHWIVAQGTALIDCNGSRKKFGKGQAIPVPAGAVCWAENSDGVALELIGVQTGKRLSVRRSRDG